MITKNDWNDALDAWVAEEREHLGGPPSPELVVAYLSGELSGAAAARVRALLVYYPELTPLLDERIETPRRVRQPFALRVYAVAATVAIALLIFERPPRIVPSVPSSHHEFNALRTRGHATPVYELPGGEQHYLITAVPFEPPADDEYEIRITQGSDVVWAEKGVRPVEGAFVVYVPREFLKPGTYELRLVHNGQRLDSFTFRVMSSPSGSRRR